MPYGLSFRILREYAQKLAVLVNLRNRNLLQSCITFVFHPENLPRQVQAQLTVQRRGSTCLPFLKHPFSEFLKFRMLLDIGVDFFCGVLNCFVAAL